MTVVLIVLVREWCCATVTVLGFAPIEKSLGTGALTVKVTVVVCVADAPVPVTVRVYVLGAAVPALIIRVALPPEVIGFGLNDADAPLGTPLIERETLWSLPEVTAVLIALVPETPWVNVRLFGLALIEKSFGTGALTVKVTVVVCMADAPVPVTVRVYVLGAAVPALIVTVELPPEVIGLGLNDADAPLGTPVIERETLCALPEVTAVLITVVPEVPWLTVKLLGLAEIEKSLTAVEMIAGGENAVVLSTSVVLSWKMYCVLGLRFVTRMGERASGLEIEMIPVIGEVDVGLPVYCAPHTWSEATQ